MRSTKKRKNDDQSLFDDIATREKLSREEQATNRNHDTEVIPEIVKVQPFESNKIDCVTLTSIRERRAPPSIFHNKQQQVPLIIPDLTPLHNDPVCLTYPIGMFVKGNEGALLAYFSELLPPKCDPKRQRCLPSHIIGAIYTATLRLLNDQILLEKIPVKSVGMNMSKKILLDTVPSSHNQLRISMSQMATNWYPKSTAIANGLRVYGVSPSIFTSSSSAVNKESDVFPSEDTCDKDMHLDTPTSELSPQSIKTMNNWFAMIQTAYDDTFFKRCTDSSTDIQDLVETYRLILIACSDRTAQEKCLYWSSKAANNILLRILDLLDEENANLVNESSSKSAGRGVESSSAKHGVAATVSNGVRRIVTDPAFLEVDVMYMASCISQSDSRTSRFFTFFAETMLAMRFSDGSLLAKGSWILPPCQSEGKGGGKGEGRGEGEGEGELLRKIMRGEYPSATSNIPSPPSKIIAVMVELSQSVKGTVGSPVVNRKGALFAFVSLIHLMFTNSAAEWDATESAQAVKRCLIFQNDLRIKFKQNSTFSDILDAISLTDSYWKTLPPVLN